MSTSTPKAPSATRIAVVIVCRNACAALAATLDSLRALADPRLLTIVIDGASSDATPELLLARRDQLFHTVSESDRGIYDAMNKGWQASPADAYVLYLGAGDHLVELPEAAALHDECGEPWPVVMGDCMVGTYIFRSRWSRELRLRNTAHHQALMIHKSVHPAPPFDTSLRVYADWEFNLRLMHRGVTAHHVPQLRAYAEPGGISSGHHNLDEIRSVASRHGGPLVGLASWALNRASLWRRRHAER